MPLYVLNFHLERVFLQLAKANSSLMSERRFRKKISIAALQQEESEITVVKLSSYILSGDQINVLSRGLSLASTFNFDPYQTIIGVNRFARSLVVKKHFLDDTFQLDMEPGVSNIQFSQYYIPTSFREQMSNRDLIHLQMESDKQILVIYRSVSFKTRNPFFYSVQTRVPALDWFQEIIQKDLVTSSTKNNNSGRHNVCNKERFALKLLKRNNDNIFVFIFIENGMYICKAAHISLVPYDAWLKIDLLY